MMLLVAVDCRIVLRATVQDASGVRVLTTASIVNNRLGEFICVVFSEDIGLLLVEELEVLNCVTQQHIFRVKDDFVASIRSADSSNDWEHAIVSVFEYNIFLTVCCLVCLLQKYTFWCELLVIQMDADLDSASTIIHIVEDFVLTSLEQKVIEVLP